MSSELKLHDARSPYRDEHTYFVGRRQFEAAEVYAVGASDVERLRSPGTVGARDLDWHGGVVARMELSRLLITRAVRRPPSRELQARFSLYVLETLPDDGFVLSSDEIGQWLRLTSDPRDFAPVQPAHRSWAGRLRSLVLGTPDPSADA